MTAAASRDDLLTAREVQDLLRIDRTTVYRMLRDGRLAGVKVGQQWRFARRSVDGLLAGEPRDPAGDAAPLLPIHCAQAIQDLFATVAGVGVVALAPDGRPLTQPSGAYRPERAGDAGRGLRWARARVAVGGVHLATLEAGPLRDAESPQLTAWLAQAARTFETIAAERAAVAERMRRIAELTELGAMRP